MQRSALGLLLVAVGIGGGAGPSIGDAIDPAAPVVAVQAPIAVDSDAQLTAREIYQRVLDNRFDSSVQEFVLVSADRAGNEQRLRIRQMWKRYPEGSRTHEKGILSRTLLRYLEPPDLRHTAYLIINNSDQPNDQFVYLKSQRRVRRMNLRDESVSGTDLSVEDLAPRELDDATYVRAADDEVDGTACFVVEATPAESTKSAYSRFLLYVEKEHYVPLRIRYWNRMEIEIKELRSPAESIREIDGIYVPIEATMRHLLEKSHTSMDLELLIPNPDLPDRLFAERQLHAKKLRLPKGLMARAHKL